jgi:hypothetical protein
MWILGWEVETADIVIRGVPAHVIVALDARAARLRLSRDEYVRRRLVQDATRDDSPVSAAHFARFAEIFGDLSDPEVLSGAWR